MPFTASPSPSLDARLAMLERRGRALTLAVAVLAPTTATLALAAFRRPAPDPLPVLEGKQLVLHGADGATVVMTPTWGGGFRIQAGRMTKLEAPRSTPEHPAWIIDGAELAVTAGEGPGDATALELRDATGRTLVRLGPPQARPAGP